MSPFLLTFLLLTAGIAIGAFGTLVAIMVWYERGTRR